MCYINIFQDYWQSIVLKINIKININIDINIFQDYWESIVLKMYTQPAIADEDERGVQQQSPQKIVVYLKSPSGETWEHKGRHQNGLKKKN